MNWPRDKTIVLFELYKARENLWNTTHPEYKDKIKRKETLFEIARALNENIDELERKISVIHSMYRRTLVQVKKMLKTGMKIDDITNRVWYGYKYMTFLSNKSIYSEYSRSYVIPVSKSNVIEPEEIVSSPIETINSETSADSHEMEIFCQPEDTEQALHDHSIPLKKRKINGSEELMTALHTLTTAMQKTYETKDECTVFGDYIGRELRKIKDEYAQAVTKHYICNIIFEAHTGKYDKYQHDFYNSETKIYPENSENAKYVHP